MLRKTLILANVIMLLTACTLPFAQGRNVGGAVDRFEMAYVKAYGNTGDISEIRSAFAETLARLSERYVDQISTDELTDRAIAGLKPEEDTDEEPLTLALNAMLTSLDDYSGYMDPAVYKRYQSSLDGQFVGFGFRIEMRDEQVTVISAFPDSPAMEAGIKSNDVISHVDGKSLKGYTLSEAVSMLRGKEGSQATLTVLRAGMPNPMQLIVERRAVDIIPVEYRVDGDVGYIRIQTFNAKTAPHVEEALDFFNEKLGDRLCGVILDMRDNPGGLVNAAVQVADEFIDEGNIFAAVNRGKKFDNRDANYGDTIDGKPVMVMLNRRSASAAEIVAGALKYSNRAQLFGERSYGKGTMQSLYSLDNGGGIRFTTGRFTVGGGASFNGEGLQPDVAYEEKEGGNRLTPIAKAGQAMSCTMSVQTAASAHNQ